MKTEHLIDTLANDVAAVRPLAGPWTRAAAWLLGALVYFGALLLMTTSLRDVGAGAGDGLFVFQQLAAFSTAVTAAGAAFALTVPGRGAGALRLAIGTGFVWLASVSLGAMSEWTRDGITIVAPAETACVAFIVFGGMLPALAMARMLRKGAPLRPGLTAGLGALATTALAGLAACLAHPHPSHAVTLAWHGTTIIVLVTLTAAAGRSVWTWSAGTGRSHGAS